MKEKIYNIKSKQYEQELIQERNNLQRMESKNLKKEMVNNPHHYGGKDNPYEAIKVIENWNCNFNIGNAIKYLSRAGKKGDIIQDLEKAMWYIQREINNLKNK